METFTKDCDRDALGPRNAILKYGNASRTIEVAIDTQVGGGEQAVAVKNRQGPFDAADDPGKPPHFFVGGRIRGIDTDPEIAQRGGRQGFGQPMDAIAENRDFRAIGKTKPLVPVRM